MAAISLTFGGIVLQLALEPWRNHTSNGLWYIERAGWERYVTLFWLLWTGFAMTLYGGVCALVYAARRRSAWNVLLILVCIFAVMFTLLHTDL